MSDAYLALEFDPSTDTVRLISVGQGGTTTPQVLDTVTHNFGSDEWRGFDIDWDADIGHILVTLDDGGETTVELSAFVDDIALGHHIGWYGEGPDDGFIVDEYYADGERIGLVEDEEEPPPPDPIDVERWPIYTIIEDTDFRVRHLAFRADGEDLAVALNGGRIMVFEASGNWNPLLEFDVESDASYLTYHPERDYFAGAFADGTLTIFDSIGYGDIVTFPSGNHYGVLRSLAWNSEDELLAVGTKVGIIHIYDTSDSNPENWNIIASENHEVSGVRSAIADLDFSPDNQYLAAGSETGSTFIYETGSWDSPIQTFNDGEESRTVAFDPTGTYLASGGGWSLDIKIREVGTWAEHPSSPLTDPTTNIHRVTWNKTGRWLAFGTHETGDVYVYDSRHDFQIETVIDEVDDDTLEAVAFHPTDRFMAYGTRQEPTEIYVHSVPFDPQLAPSAGASTSMTLIPSNVVRDRMEMSAGASIDIGYELTGPDKWHILTDREAIVVDSISPSITQTVTPGRNINFTAVFQDPDTYGERYATMMEYAEIAADVSVRYGMTDIGKPWYRERIQHESIESLVVRVNPGVGADSEQRGWWGVITNITDTSHSFTDIKAVEIECVVLSELHDYKTHAELRADLEAPVFGADTFDTI